MDLYQLVSSSAHLPSPTLSHSQSESVLDSSLSMKGSSDRPGMPRSLSMLLSDPVENGVSSTEPVPFASPSTSLQACRQSLCPEADGRAPSSTLSILLSSPLTPFIPEQKPCSTSTIYSQGLPGFSHLCKSIPKHDDRYRTFEDDEGYQTSVASRSTTECDSPTTPTSAYTSTSTGMSDSMAQLSYIGGRSLQYAPPSLQVGVPRVSYSEGNLAGLYAIHEVETPKSRDASIGPIPYRRPHSSSAPVPYPLPIGLASSHPVQHQKASDQSVGRQRSLTVPNNPKDPPPGKPWACSGCEQFFARKYDMIRHARKHTGERPYSCSNPACKETFSRPDALQRHYATKEACEPHKPNSWPGAHYKQRYRSVPQ